MPSRTHGAMGSHPDWSTLNGQTMLGTANCRYTLEQAHALRRVPSPDRGCIASGSTPSVSIRATGSVEKRYQVAMMGRICARATEVVACSGCHENNSEDLIQVLQSARDLSRIVLEHQRLLPRVGNDWFDFLDETTLRSIKISIQAPISSQSPIISRLIHRFLTFRSVTIGLGSRSSKKWPHQNSSRSSAGQTSFEIEYILAPLHLSLLFPFPSCKAGRHYV